MPIGRSLRVILRVVCCAACVMFCLYTGTAAAAAPNTPSALIDSYTITQRGDGYRVNISYPKVGNAVADAELAIWAREQAAAFTESVRMIPTSPAVPYELYITYETVQASARTVSIVFFISTSMGGAHPEPGLATFVYDKRDGRRLSYGNIFMEHNGMPRFLSDICRASLAAQLGDKAVPDMIEAGTAPDMANFDLFTLIRNGIRIYFPPYQAAPYSAGYLKVSIPLADLAEFKPHLALWDTP